MLTARPLATGGGSRGGSAPPPGKIWATPRLCCPFCRNYRYWGLSPTWNSVSPPLLTIPGYGAAHCPAPMYSSSIYTATCMKHEVWRENLVYNQTTRWRRCSYLVYKYHTRGQRCSYWTAPDAPQRLRLIYGLCPRFAPKTVDAPINSVHHIGRKLRYLGKFLRFFTFYCGNKRRKHITIDKSIGIIILFCITTVLGRDRSWNVHVTQTVLPPLSKTFLNYIFSGRL